MERIEAAPEVVVLFAALVFVGFLGHSSGDAPVWPYTIVIAFFAVLGRGQRWIRSATADGERGWRIASDGLADGERG